MGRGLSKLQTIRTHVEHVSAEPNNSCGKVCKLLITVIYFSENGLYYIEQFNLLWTLSLA